MKVAVIGSRSLTVSNLEKCLPAGVTEIVSGGARGVDTSAREYARAHGLPCTEFLPEYGKYGRTAPLKRNLQIIEYADLVLAFWDGESRGHQRKPHFQVVDEQGRQDGGELRPRLGHSPDAEAQAAFEKIIAKFA